MITAHRLTPRSDRMFQPIAPAPISPGVCLFVLPREPSIELFDLLNRPPLKGRLLERDSANGASAKPERDSINGSPEGSRPLRMPVQEALKLESNSPFVEQSSTKKRRRDESQFFCHKVRGNIWYAFSQDDFIMLLRDDVDPGKEIEAHPGVKAPFVNKHGVFEYYQIFDSIKDLIRAHWKLTYMMDHEHYPPDYAIVDHGEMFLWDGEDWVTLQQAGGGGGV